MPHHPGRSPTGKWATFLHTPGEKTQGLSQTRVHPACSTDCSVLMLQCLKSNRGRLCDYTTHVCHGVSNSEQNSSHDYLKNPPSKKVVTHLKIFVWVFERPLHWQNAYAILFFLNLLLAGCETVDMVQTVSLRLPVDGNSIPQVTSQPIWKISKNLFMV